MRDGLYQQTMRPGTRVVVMLIFHQTPMLLLPVFFLLYKYF